jgi:signal recognition particle subunit SEC65
MNAKTDKKICFVISPIGEDDSDTRKRSDQVLKHIITGAVEQLGYEVIRADKISEPGIITHQIIQHIVDAPLVIADLTERNPNVFYELALRHAIRKPLVQLIKKGELIPFDVAATRIIQFDLHNLDSVDAAKLEIIAQVKSLEAGKNDTDNPISVSLDLKMLKESGDPEERSLADIVEAISDLRLTITSADKGFPSSKIFKEFQMMLDDLNSKISRLDPDYKRGRRKFHPMMFEELMHIGMEKEDPNLSFLMMISFIKDDFPWIYEVGLETYRGLKSTKSKTEKRRLVESFERAFEMTGHPMMREFYGKSEEMYMFSKDIRHFMHRFLDRYMGDEKSEE